MATGGRTRPVRDDWTCTIRRDVASWPGYIAEELFPSTLVPVCAPALAAGLRKPSDLHKATLIFVPHVANDWACWFEAAGLRQPFRPRAEVFFDNNAMAVQAVLDGVGVAAVQPLYVTDALVSGRLVTPFPIIATKREAWYLEYRPLRAEDAALIAFREWLHVEARHQREIEADLIRKAVRPMTKRREQTAK
jgi:LysR family transcriptional regulator, regulator of gene expression of beta-lactamase